MKHETRNTIEILAVDDTLTQLKTLSSILTGNGFKVRPAISGALALNAVKQKKPDLILLDITMPGMNGYEVCERLKADEDTREIPIIFISAMDNVQDKVKAFKMGGVDYITKPYQIDEVLMRVQIHLTISEMQKSIVERNKKLEETLAKLKQAQSKLVQSEKMASLGLLMAGIAHEINNPINFISGGLNSLALNFQEIKEVLSVVNKLEMDKDNSKWIQEIINTKDKVDLETIEDEIGFLFKSINNGTQRATEIIKSMLSFIRTSKSNFEEYDLHKGLDSSLIMLQSKLKNKIEVVKNYGKIPLVQCNSGQINQVLLNILLNAVQAIEEKGEICIFSSTEKNMVIIEISDNGKGITEEEKQNIFDPFYTTKAVGKGTGLGLSISYSIIENHGGSVECESSPGKGSTFIIKLPYKT